MQKNIANKQTFLRSLYPLVLLLLALVCSSCESNRVIVNKLEEKDANEILVYLSANGISATKSEAAGEGGGGSKVQLWNVSVPEYKANEAMALLNQVGLPRRRSQNLLGIFSSSSLVPSGMQEKVKYQAGLGEQLASIIRKIDGVLDAEVQISVPEEDPLNPGSNKQPVTAAVFVQHTGILDDPNSHLSNRIKSLVSGSVPGLAYNNVTVVGDRARVNEAQFRTLSDSDRNLVQVWSLMIAQESVGLFQTIFFSLITLLVLALFILALLIWMCYPLFKQFGSVKSFFKQLISFQPITLENLQQQAQNSDKGEEHDQTTPNTTESTESNSPEDNSNKDVP